MFFDDIKKYWKYIVFSAKTDLKSEVTNSYLDWIWWILEPVCNTLIYYFVFGYVFKSKEPFFLVFIYIGLTFWSFFNKIMRTSVNLVRNNKKIISKIYIPKQIMLLSKMMSNGFKMLISICIIAVLLIIFGIHIDFHIFEIIPVIFVFLVFTYGCGCILLHFGVYVNDLSYIVTIVLNMLFFLTGIFYSIDKKLESPLKEVCLFGNPLAFIIDSLRKIVIYAKSFSIIPFFVWLIISISLACIGTKLIYKNENNYVKVI